MSPFPTKFLANRMILPFAMNVFKVNSISTASTVTVTKNSQLLSFPFKTKNKIKIFDLIVFCFKVQVGYHLKVKRCDIFYVAFIKYRRYNILHTSDVPT